MDRIKSVLKQIGIDISPKPVNQPQDETIAAIVQKALAASSTAEAQPLHQRVTQKTPYMDSILSNRVPLISYLGPYVALDELGYPKATGHSLDVLKRELQKNLKKLFELGECFYKVAEGGDAGYAHDLRVFLAGHGITSPQVMDTAGRTSYYDSMIRICPPGTRPLLSDDLWLDLWGSFICEGHINYGQNNSSVETENKITLAQKAYYEASCLRIKKLHQEGWLLARVASCDEIKAVAKYEPRMDNQILSTTLLPRESSTVLIELFGGNVGMLCDPSRVHGKNFGLAFQKNGFTRGMQFLDLKKRKKLYSFSDGARSLQAQHDLLESFAAIKSAGGKLADIDCDLVQDSQSWELKMSKRSGMNDLFIGWNEAAYYRGVGGDLLVGLFLKGITKKEYAKFELKKLVISQNYIRLTTGRFLPIFELDEYKNHLKEIEITPDLLSSLGLSDLHKQKFKAKL